MSDESSVAFVVVELLGPPRWRGPSFDAAALSRKDAALFALVALGASPPRERVAAWLWPEVPAKTAQVNLRQRLFKLRQLSGHPLIDSGATLSLAAGVKVDAAATEPADEGDLLGGFDYGDLEALDGWVVAERERLARVRLEQQLARAAKLESEGALAGAIELCERIVAKAPWHEHAWRRLMRAHYQRGDRAAAIDAFERCERFVRGEQGSRPSADTLALLATIERLEAPAPAVRWLPDCLQHPPVMVGRDGLLERLQAAWSAGRSVLLLGEGGIGKSRLLAEFLRWHEGVQQRRARPGEAASAYATAVLLLREVMERWQPALEEATRAELARLLPGLGTPPQGDGQQALLWQACEQLLLAAHAGGLRAIVVDDLQHADEASLELLRWCVASPALSVLRFAFASRPLAPGPAAQWLADWSGDSSRIELLRVGPLSETQLQQLLDSLPLQGTMAGAAQRTEALFRHAGGHPFFTLETLKALALEARGPDGDSPLPAPASAQAMLERHLQRLSPAARELAAVAALAGGDWLPELAPPLLGRSVLALAPAWSELEAAHLMQGHGFAHDLVREAALGLVPPSWRAGLHAQLAEAMAARPQSDPARVAEHWWAAARWREAASALREAAQRTRQAGRLETSEALLQRAADAHDRSGDAEARFAALADAAAAAMLRLSASDAAARLQDLAPLARHPDEKARLALLQAEAAFNAAEFPQALRHSASALALASPGSAVALDAEILHGHALAIGGRTDEGVHRLQHAVESAAANGLSDKEAAAWAGLAYALHAGARIGEAVQAQQRAVALTRRRSNRSELAHALANLASVAHSAGDAPLALAQAVEADALFQAIGAAGVHTTWNSVTVARNAPATGRFDLAMQALRLLHEGAAAAGPMAVAYVRMAHATTWSWLGRPAEALAALPPDGPEAGAAVHARVAACRAKLRRLQGEPAASPDAAAREALRHALGSAREEAALLCEWASLLPAAEALERLGRARSAAQASGAAGTARSLAACELECLLEHDPAAAGTLAAALRVELPLGLHCISYPPQAWWAVARALRHRDLAAAEACRLEAQRWIDNAVMPDDYPAMRETFRQGNPVNRAVLAGWAAVAA